MQPVTSSLEAYRRTETGRVLEVLADPLGRSEAGMCPPRGGAEDCEGTSCPAVRTTRNSCTHAGPFSYTRNEIVTFRASAALVQPGTVFALDWNRRRK